MSDPNRPNTDDNHDHAHTTPRRWLRLDGLTLFAAGVALFTTTGQTWWLLPLVILLPDLFMVGYLRDTRVGAHVYNLGHTYLLPAALSLAAVADHHPLPLAVGLLWLAHIGMDRTLGYGIKYTDDFTHTHLGHLRGRRQEAETSHPEHQRQVPRRSDRWRPEPTKSARPTAVVS